MSYPFLKGHGTHNDFVILPDLDGTVHADITAERIRALCDRRGGIGGDGILRVVNDQGRWFMDYRNADGTIAEMCGNGVRVFARYLADERHIDDRVPLEVDTRDGVKTITFTGDQVTVDMGVPRVLGMSRVSIGDRTWVATQVDVGNPHAVAFVDDLAEAGPLLEAPSYDAGVFPDGVNIEFVVRRGEGHVAMRVHERGSGETQACGTGACAVAVAAMPDGGAATYRVDQPGGTVTIERTAEGRVLMTGPAVIVARGTTDL
jgi:diaminopimelate epimerase